MASLSLLLFAACLLVARGVRIDGKIIANPKLPLKIASSDIRVTLNQGAYNAFARRNGKFRFEDVPPGVYSLDVVHSSFVFPQYTLRVGEKHVRASFVRFPGAMPQDVPTPLRIEPQSIANFFEARPKMSILGMLRNPMLLMTMLPLVFVGLSKLLPKDLDLKEPQREAERARDGEQYEAKEDLEDEDE